MNSSAFMPQIEIAAASSGSTPNENGLSDLAVTCHNLLSDAAGLVSIAGVKTLILTSGEITQASAVEIGNGETADEVAANLAELREIARYCNANNIKVRVDANLTNAAVWSEGSGAGQNELVDQWAPEAAEVGLPIDAVEDVQEVSTVQPSPTFAVLANVEANAVRTLIENYVGSSYHLTSGNLTVGDMEGGGNNPSTWWNAYNAAAQVESVPNFSFVTADTDWFGPWITVMSQPTWQQYLGQMGSYAAAANMSLDVLVQGEATDPTAAQFARQSEQNAADLAMLQGMGRVRVSSIEVESWNAQPVGVGMITTPGSPVNEAAEISACYPLYAAGSITAKGTASVSAPNQVVLKTGIDNTVGSFAVEWSAADVTAGNRITVVLIDQTGTLTATQHGMGTVTQSADNILVLNGNSADIAAELNSVTLQESSAGADTIDIETFGVQGQLTDEQINVFAVAQGQPLNATAASSGNQGWTACSATFNTGTVVGTGSVMTSETLSWSTTGIIGSTLSGSSTYNLPAYLNIIAIHEPLAEYGVENIGSIIPGSTAPVVADIFDSRVDPSTFPSNGYANNAGVNNVISPQTTGWLPTSFNAAAALTPLTVASSVLTFDPSGALLSLIANLAPDPITVADLTGPHADSFATAFNLGGTQVTEYNTGDNLAWNAGWGGQFATATLTYDGSGQLVELFLQGSAQDPWLSFDYIFDPSTGKLWEEFQTTSPPPAGVDGVNYASTSNPYQPGYATGPMYETQFNTGGNPNWNYLDWGSSALANTETWTDYFIMSDKSGFTTTASPSDYTSLSYYGYQFINGSALDLMYLPGTIQINLNNLGTVVIDSQPMPTSFTDLNTIDAVGATGTIELTGLVTGNCTLIGGDDCSTIGGFGNDTIVAGAGFTQISTGAGNSNVQIGSTTGTVYIEGNSNRITAVSGSTLFIAGTNNTVSGPSSCTTMLNGQSTLEADEFSASSTIFMGVQDTVILDETCALSGTIKAVAGDEILLPNLTFTNAYYANGTLVVCDGSNPVTSFSLLGNYSSDVFVVNGHSIQIEQVAPDDTSIPSVSLVAAPTLNDNGNVVLGTVTAGDGNDTLEADLTSDAVFPSGSSLILSNGTLIYTPGVLSAGSGGNDVISYTIKDCGSSAEVSETQMVTLVRPYVTLGLGVHDVTANQAVVPAVEAYTGPVSGLTEQYIDLTSDSLNISASTPNWFIHSGSGNDAISVFSGTNILDGGTGSNFLTGGSGSDTFFVDDRSATADIWNTVNNFHAGDAATIWGVSPGSFNLEWMNGQGATGYTGLTLHATAIGLPTASLTLVGFNHNDLANGRLSISYGTDPASGSNYMYVLANR